MTTFPKAILDNAYILREIYGDSRNQVIISYPVIEIINLKMDIEYSTKLLYDSKKGLFEIQPPTYRFYSKISHFDFRKPESRWSRRKDRIFQLIKILKYSGLWEMVSNKDFLVINEHNDKINPGKLNKILEDLS